MNKETAHTPGPWLVIKGSACDENSAYDFTVGQDVPDGHEGHVVATHIESGDDVRLISAAPDLLAALKGMERWAAEVFDGYPPSTASRYADTFREAARAAIAKAEGRHA